MKLSARLFLLFAGGLVALATLIFFLTDRTIRQVLESGQKAQFENRVHAIQSIVAQRHANLEATRMVENYERQSKDRAIMDIKDHLDKEADQFSIPLLVTPDGEIKRLRYFASEKEKEKEGETLSAGMKAFVANYANSTNAKEPGISHTDVMIRGEAYWMVSTELGAWDWQLAYLVPHAAKFRDLFDFRRRFLLILLAALALMIPLSMFAVSKVIRPIRRLSEAAKEFSSGKRLVELPVRGTDEIAALTRNFADMRRAIGDQLRVIRENERLLGSTLANLPGVVFKARVQPGGQFQYVYVSEKSRDLFNVSPHPVEFWDQFLERLDPGERSALTASLRTAIHTRADWHTDGKIADGRESSVFFRASALHVLEEENSVYYGLFLDVTEEKRVESQLKQSQKMDAIGQLAGGIAHDFNNMLCSIMGSAELLKMDLPPESEFQTHVDVILKSSDHAAGLTRKLLPFSRTSASLNERISVHEVLQGACDLLRQTIDRRISLIESYDATDDCVVGIESELASGFLNILINASHALEQGGTIRVETQLISLSDSPTPQRNGASAAAPSIRISIRDDGVGIPADVLSRIFEPFFTTKKADKGTGLGLSVVYRTIQQHNGDIRVESEPGIGTAFHITLPVFAVTKTKSLPSERPTLPRGQGTILVVDDEPHIRLMLTALLQKMGYNVMTAEDGLRALDVYNASHDEIDLVLLDMVMPRLNGPDCFNALLDVNPEVQVVISSGYCEQEELDDLRTKGIKGFVPKPYKTEELGLVIADVFES